MKFKKGGHDVVPIFTKKKCPDFVGKFFVFALFLIVLFGSDITKVPEKQTDKVFSVTMNSFCPLWFLPSIHSDKEKKMSLFKIATFKLRNVQ